MQKKGSIKHTFEFKPNYFNFAYDDKSGSADFDFNYGDLPKKTATQIEENEGIKIIGYLWCLLGFYELGSALYHDLATTGKAFWIIMGLLCLLWSKFTRVEYTIFRAEQGNVFVLRDKQHDRIIDELKRRRKEQLLSWYGDVNLENTLDQEINKFNWLVDQGVLSRDIADKRIAQVELTHNEMSGEDERNKLN